MAAEGRRRRPIPLRRRGASMGPRPDGRGRLLRQARKHAPLKLQWGRGRMAAEGPRRLLARRLWSYASMGPRPDGRGRMCLGTFPLGHRQLQWGRGRMAAEGCISESSLFWPSSSFNGAAAGWPRKVFSMQWSSNPPLRLQWGRGRMAAEGARLYGYAASTDRLQWGRGRMAAEGCWPFSMQSMHPPGFNGAAAGWPRKAAGRRAGRYCHDEASMGPRPDGRGRGVPGQAIRPDNELQWGRGRMAAEGRAAPLHSDATRVLQWGRGRMAAEGARARPSRARSAGFNGAAAGWPRKVNPGVFRYRNSSSFNGAAAGWPRKAESPARPPPGLPASMGPRPDGRGRSRGWTGILHGGARFNGAAAGWPRKEGVGQVRGALPGASMGPRPDGRGRPARSRT